MREGANYMHSELLRPEADDSGEAFPYSYLLEWEWPEHIELLLRRLIWSRLVELGQESPSDSNDIDPSDYLAAKVCWLIAVSPQTHPAVLDVLASSGSTAFAERIAENPNAAPSTLARLAGHSNAKVRCAVAENANSPEEVVRILADDEDADVRYSLAENHNLIQDVLEKLSEDDNCYVAARARRTLCRLSPPQVVQMPFKQTQQAAKPIRKAAMG